MPPSFSRVGRAAWLRMLWEPCSGQRNTLTLLLSGATTANDHAVERRSVFAKHRHPGWGETPVKHTAGLHHHRMDDQRARQG